MHFLNPVAQAVHDHAADDRMICVERIAGASVVGISGAVLFQDVIPHFLFELRIVDRMIGPSPVFMRC